LMFAILTRAEMEMKKSSLSQMVFEMALLRLIETRPFQKIDDLIKKINQSENSNIESLPVQSGGLTSHETISAPPPNKVSENSRVSWNQIKQQVSRTKPFFEHYLEKCQVPTLNEKEIHLVFHDKFTFDLVQTPENIQFLKKTAKTVYGNEVDIKLTLDTSQPPVPVTGEEKKKSVDNEDTETAKQKSESEIIQDALDIFGGVVVK
jgi:DNA polymerase III gamma/tau subunit